MTFPLGHVLNEFVRNCALPYLEEESPEVRRAAALTCCRLFDRDPICYQASNHSIEIVSDVLDKLLTVGIADPGASWLAINSITSIHIPVQSRRFVWPSYRHCTRGSTSTWPKRKTSGLCSLHSTMNISKTAWSRWGLSGALRFTTPHM